MQVRSAVLLIVMALACSVAQAQTWQQILTQQLDNTDGFRNHETVFRPKHALSGRAYWGVDLNPVQPYDMTTPAFCIDIEHGLNTANHAALWTNVVDDDDLVTCLKKIYGDDETYTDCDLTDAALAETLDQSVLPLAQQRAATATWCDIRRIIKHRGALVWIMNERDSLIGTTPSNSECTLEINYSHIQSAIWKVVENKDKTGGQSGLAKPGGSSFVKCADYVAQLMLDHNDYVLPCGDQPTEVIAPLIVKSKKCTDAHIGGCKQYLLVERKVTIECGDDVDPTSEPECECLEKSIHCLDDDGEDHIDYTAHCGCVRYVANEDPLNPSCTTRTVECAATA